MERANEQNNSPLSPSWSHTDDFNYFFFFLSEFDFHLMAHDSAELYMWEFWRRSAEPHNNKQKTTSGRRNLKFPLKIVFHQPWAMLWLFSLHLHSPRIHRAVSIQFQPADSQEIIFAFFQLIDVRYFYYSSSMWKEMGKSITHK